MSKRHQYVVSSRPGQTAVHRKERRKLRQSLPSVPTHGKVKTWEGTRPSSFDAAGSGPPALLRSSLSQPLGAILATALGSAGC